MPKYIQPKESGLFDKATTKAGEVPSNWED